MQFISSRFRWTATSETAKALKNASASLRLSQFFLHAPAETFRADNGAFVQAAHGKSALAVARNQSYGLFMLDWSKCAAVERIAGKVSGAWLATAAIMQSARLRERRPVWLNRRAASTASAGRKGSGFGKICRAMASAGASSGPHKNSAQAMLLALQSSCACVQPRNFSCAAEPATTVWMRKLVSK